MQRHTAGQARDLVKCEEIMLLYAEVLEMYEAAAIAVDEVSNPPPRLRALLSNARDVNLTHVSPCAPAVPRRRGQSGVDAGTAAAHDRMVCRRGLRQKHLIVYTNLLMDKVRRRTSK